MFNHSGSSTMTKHGGSGAAPALLTLGGIAAAFGVASCCALPFLLATAGLSTAWLGGIALFAAPHRPLLLAAAVLCFTIAAVLLWRQRKAAACSPGAICARPAARAATAVGLLLGLALLTLGYAFV
ncbi:mercuric transporter MerT family protein [Lichenicoccus sp.]|uniref:mercuric transporter MerT family protein n=1 Tax=Lichenicoccus sp. TaxID=2781899 RepID=UPI003D0AF44E